MKAIGVTQFGDITNLQEFTIELEPMGPKDVLIDIKAISVNPYEAKLRAGRYGDFPTEGKPLILGNDFAGIVRDVGVDVTDYQIGDRVTGKRSMDQPGTYRQQIVANEDLLVRIPDSVDLASAATLKTAGATAYQALFTKGHLKSGETVLIHGGAGGVGHFAVQLAKLAGGYVITTASPKNHELLATLGADRVLDYHDPTLYDKLPELDLVIDTIGGNTQIQSLKHLSSKGRLVSLIEKSNPNDERITYFSSKYLPEVISELLSFLESGELSVHIDREMRFNLNNVKEAHKLLESGHTTGKIVLNL